MTVPGLEQQRNALRKGLGRTAFWAASGQLADEPLLEACLTDLRYDQQIDDSRGEWLWGLIQSVGAAQRFRKPILHALYDLSDERSLNQLCELALGYALAGDDTFADQIRRIVAETPFHDRPWLGESELIRLDGAAGLLLAARVRGAKLAHRSWEWDDQSLVDTGVEILGSSVVETVLADSMDISVRRFRAAALEARKGKPTTNVRPSYAERMQAPTLEEIQTHAASDEPDLFLLRGWGRYADPDDLFVIQRRLTEPGQDAKLIANLLHVFTRRPFPVFDPSLINLAAHGDAEVRRRAIFAFEQVTHPAVRQLALERITNADNAHAVVGLLVRNYHPGDEQIVLDGVELPDDPDLLHSLFLDVHKLLEANPDANPSELCVIGYALTPCSECRGDFAKMLHERGCAPPWLTAECAHDACESVRWAVETDNR